MITRPTVLERAFELARSGKFATVDLIKKALRGEKYTFDEVDQLTGPSLVTQLRMAIEKTSRGDKPPAAAASQLVAARLLLGWTRAQVAEQVGVVESTIRNVERRARPSPAMVERLQAFYEANGVEFIEKGTGVRLKT